MDIAATVHSLFSSNTAWWFQPTPLKNMRKSVGMMTFPTEWKNKIHVPNHQPEYNFSWLKPIPIAVP